MDELQRQLHYLAGTEAEAAHVTAHAHAASQIAGLECSVRQHCDESLRLDALLLLATQVSSVFVCRYVRMDRCIRV